MDLLADLFSVLHYIWSAASVLLFVGAIVMVIILFAKPSAAIVKKIAAITVWSFFGWCGITIFAQMLLGGCPLTIIENELRTAENPLFVPMESFLVTSCHQHFGCNVGSEVITHLTLMLAGFSVLLLLLMIIMGKVTQYALEARRRTK